MKILTTPNIYNIRKAEFLKAGQQIPKNTVLKAANAPVFVVNAPQLPVVDKEKLDC